MNGEIKFRAWDKDAEYMLPPAAIHENPELLEVQK